MSAVDRLKSYLPEFLISAIFLNILSSQGDELDGLNNNIKDLLNQCFVNTATWGLDLWEQFLGIPKDATKDSEYRKAAIISKIRGVGTVTTSLIENVAESFDNGQITIVEHPNTYSFEVKLSDVRGIPPNIADLQNAIDQIKPAHLAVTYVFIYLTWAEFDALSAAVQESMTWDQLEVYKP